MGGYLKRAWKSGRWIMANTVEKNDHPQSDPEDWNREKNMCTALHQGF